MTGLITMGRRALGHGYMLPFSAGEPLSVHLQKQQLPGQTAETHRKASGKGRTDMSLCNLPLGSLCPENSAGLWAHRELRSSGNCNRYLKFSQGRLGGRGAKDLKCMCGLDQHQLRPVSVQLSQHHEVAGVPRHCDNLTRDLGPSTNLWLVLEPLI